jgi:hypothetical protein
MIYGIEDQVPEQGSPPAAAVPPQVEHDLQATAYCRGCQKFSQLQHALSALADADTVPASVYFQVSGILAPSHSSHMRRLHPFLYAYERQMEAARQAVLGLPT